MLSTKTEGTLPVDCNSADMAEAKQVPQQGRLVTFALVGLALLVIGYWLNNMLVLTARYSYGDEGFLAEAARRIYFGEVPYRDFFNLNTPGAYYFYAFLFKLLGPTFFALRVGVVLTACMVFGGVWWVLYRLNLRKLIPYAMAAVFLPHYGATSWFLASHHWLVLALCLISLAWLLTDETESGYNWKMGVAGGVAALSGFTMQHKGGVWILAVIVGLMCMRRSCGWRGLRCFVLGLLAVALPLVVVFVSIVGWDTLVADLITFPLTQYRNMESHHGDVFETLRQSWVTAHSSWLYRNSVVDWARIIGWHAGFVGYLVVYLLPGIAGAALYGLWRRNTVPRQHLALLIAFWIASYLGALHRPSDSTWVFASPAGLIPMILWLQGGARPSLIRTRLTRGWLVLFSIVSIGCGTVGFLAPRAITDTPAGKVESVLAGEAETMQGVTNYLRLNRQPDDKVFCFPYLAMFYFLLQIENPTRFDLLSYPMNTQAQMDEVEATLEREKVRWVLWNYYPLENDSVGTYLKKHYRVNTRYKYVAVLERLPLPNE